MRVILDTNVWISILLSPTPLTTNHVIEEAFLGRQFITIVPEELITEIRGATLTRKWLAERISPAAVETLVAMFYERAIVTPAFAGASDQILRDARDDYLIRAGRTHQIDILVSGDGDVLAHAGNEEFSILTPPAFVAALKELAEW